MLASKFEKYGTVSYVRENGKIIAICAGYTNDQVQRLGYISVVASLPEYTNKGYGKVAVQGFIEKAKNAGMKAIHLYADKENRVEYVWKAGICRLDYSGRTKTRGQTFDKVDFIEEYRS